MHTAHFGSDARIEAVGSAASALPVAVPVGAMVVDVSIATAAEGLTVGLMEGKAPATLAQRLGARLRMAMRGEKDFGFHGRIDGWKEV